MVWQAETVMQFPPMETHWAPVAPPRVYLPEEDEEDDDDDDDEPS